MQTSYDSVVLTYVSVVLTKDTGVIRVLPIDCDQWKAFVVVVVALLFYVHGKHLRSCRDGQLT